MTHRQRNTARRATARGLGLLTGLVLVATGLAPAAAEPGGDDAPAQSGTAPTTVYDFADAHAWDGFGSQSWWTELSDAKDAVMTDLNMKWLRLASPAPSLSAAQLGDGGQSVDDFLAMFDATYTQIAANRTDQLVGVMNDRGIQVQLISWQMPTAWMTRQTAGCPDNATSCWYIPDAHIGDYANLVTASVEFALREGVPARLVELTNEPEGYWNGLWTPQQYVQLVQLTRAALDVRGLQDIGIEGPGTGTERNAVPYLEELETSGAINDLAAISAHNYDTSYTDRCDVRECLTTPVGLSDEFQAALAGLSVRLPIRITEFENRDRAMWNVAPYDCNDGSAGVGRTNGVCALNTPLWGLWFAAEDLKMIGDGATSTLQWELSDMSFTSVNWGLITLSGQHRPGFYALQAFQSQLATATSAVRGSTSDQQVVTTAFRSGSKIVLVAANLTDQARTIQPEFAGLGSWEPQYVDQQLSYSGQTGNLTIPDAVSTSSGSLEAQIPANSLVSITFDSTPPTLPTAPVMRAPVTSGTTLQLSWGLSSNAQGYVVKYGTTSGNYTHTVDVGFDTTYPITGLEWGTTYYYTVAAYNSVGEGADAPEGSATPLYSMTVDNTDTSAVRIVGDWITGGSTGYYGTNYLHDRNAGAGTKSVTYTPSGLPAGLYQVSLWWPSDPNRATAVPVTVQTGDGTTTIAVNQRLNGSRWNAIGTFWFDGDGTEFVRISNAGADGYVIADAVRFEQVSDATPPTTNAKVVSGFAPRWTASGVYTAGGQVVHNGEVRNAQWWTRNQEPGLATGTDSWQPTGTC